MNDSSPPGNSWLVRNEFLLRRLHSLSGLIPVGAFMCVHLLVNASVLDSPSTFQSNVYQIHSLGQLLWIVEWAFIFLPILFHAIFGVIIIRGGLPNHSSYPLASNIRYTLQRVTGMITFLFILWHVGHMHGWFHFDAWIQRIAPFGGAQFRPYNAASSLGWAMQNPIVAVGYAVGVLSCVFHLANGIWTMGITWGVWVSPIAQKRANYVCSAFGVGLAIVGMAALYGSMTVPVERALESEQRMYDARIAAEFPVDEVEEKKEYHKHHRKLWSDEELEELKKRIAEESPDNSTETETETTSAQVEAEPSDLQ